MCESLDHFFMDLFKNTDSFRDNKMTLFERVTSFF